IIYTISTALFVMWLNWKVKKPLEKLNKAMISLSEGGTYESIEYKGSHEFMQICENFNAMSQKLNKSKEENEHLQSEKQKMLADISHDLKTPITIIQGYAKALSDGIISKDDQEKYLKIIYEKSNNLTELIN
ncbi:histidine kinase dimerization/phospho-acceptor domain-containing protein, partial [Clostridium tertium]